MTKKKIGASRAADAATKLPKSRQNSGKTPREVALALLQQSKSKEKAKPKPPPKTTFLTLPPELRNRIYTLALVPLSGWPIALRAGQNHLHRGRLATKKSWRRESWREPALLKVSKEIRAEALPLYYGSNCFVVDVFMEDLAEASRWMRSVVSGNGGRATVFLSLTFVVHCEAWAKLEEFRPFIQLLREVGPNLARAKRRDVRAVDVGAGVPQPPIFEMSRNTGEYIQYAFDEIIALGAQAHKEGWSEEWLDWEFMGLVERLWETGGGVKAAKNGREKAAKNGREKVARERLLARWRRG